MPYFCPHCGKKVKTQRGVKQHVNQSPECLAKQEGAVLTQRRGKEPDDEEASDMVPQVRRLNNEPFPSAPRGRTSTDPQGKSADSIASPSLQQQEQANSPFKSPVRKKHRSNSEWYTENDVEFDPNDDDESRNSEATNLEDDYQPNKELKGNFHTYCAEHANKYVSFSKSETSCIQLMDCLRKKAPLNAYQSVLEWHLKETGQLKKHQRLGDLDDYPHRATLMKRMMHRYNCMGLMPHEKRVELPSSKTIQYIPCRNAADCIVSLLTDPRFEAKDYLFYDQDPFAKPPEKLMYLGDLNTGDAYLRTYEKMITKENQVLLPVPLYIDGAVTGQFSDLLTVLLNHLGLVTVLVSILAM